MGFPWVLLLFAAVTAALNLHAQYSGEMMTRIPFRVFSRSEHPGLFIFNLIGRWVIVAVVLGLVGAAEIGLLPRHH